MLATDGAELDASGGTAVLCLVDHLWFVRRPVDALQVLLSVVGEPSYVHCSASCSLRSFSSGGWEHECSDTLA